MTEKSTDTSTLNSTYEDKQIYDVPVEELLEDREQPRKWFDDKAQEALKKSLIKYGLVTPIAFRQREQDGRLMVVAGERRVRAIKSILRKARQNPENQESLNLLNDFEKIKGVFISDEHKVLSIIENVQRENLNPVELAEGLAKLKEDKYYGTDHLAVIIGKSESTVYEVMSINKLPKEIRDEARERSDISQWVLVEVAKASGPKAKLKRWESLKDSGMTQADYRKKKAAADKRYEKKYSSSFSFKASMRAVKTASTQIQKLKGPEVENITTEERQELRAQLETLQDELAEVLDSISK